MQRFSFLLIAILGFQFSTFADNELDDRLKSVMLLFDKKQQELTETIGRLELENQKMILELEKLKNRNHALFTENISLKKQLGIAPEKQIETASSSRNLDQAGSLSSNAKTSSDASTSLINVNVAGTTDLELLPGVGPVIAQRIIDNRPYAAVEDLLKVRGIGKTSIEILRPLVTVE